MGVLTRSELTSEIKHNLGDRSDVDSSLINYLNFAQDELARLALWSELETLVETTTSAGTKTISLPSKPRDIYSFRLIDSSRSRKLIYYTPRQFDALFPYPEWRTQGRPSIYTNYRETIEVLRIPDDSYPVYLRYLAWPTAFSDSSDVVSDFESKDDILIAMATAWAFNRLGEHEKASRWYNSANYQIRQAVKEDRGYTDSEVRGSSNMPSASTEYWKNPFIKGVS